MPDLPDTHAVSISAPKHVDPKREMERKARERQRHKDTGRIQGRRLQIIRQRILRRDPLCKICLAKTPRRVEASKEVDHIIPLHLGGKEEDSNRQGLCVDCHKDKTAREATDRSSGYIKQVIPAPQYNIK